MDPKSFEDVPIIDLSGDEATFPAHRLSEYTSLQLSLGQYREERLSHRVACNSRRRAGVARFGKTCKDFSSCLLL